MKKYLIILMALCMLLSLAACDTRQEQGVTIVNKLDVDLVDVKVGISDGSINGIILAEKLARGESAVLSLQEICNGFEGFVSIQALDEDANAYTLTEVKLYDGVTVTLERSNNVLYANYTYNNGQAQYSGQIIPYQPPVTPPDNSAEKFIGSWEYKDYDIWLEIYDDGTYKTYNGTGTSTTGTYKVEKGTMTLSKNGATFTVDQDGNLLDKDADVLIPLGSNGRGAYDGYWLYENGYVLEIANNVWVLYDDTGAEYLAGFMDYENMTGKLLYGDQSDGFGTISKDGSGNVSVNGDNLTKIDEFPYRHTRADYQGFWQNSNGQVLYIHEDYWFAYDTDCLLIQAGSMDYRADVAYLMNADGSSGGGQLWFNDEGILTEMGDPLTRLDSFHAQEDYQGYWQNGAGDIIQIYGAEWYLYGSDGSLIQSGPVDYKPEAAYLMNADGSSGGGQLWFNDEDILTEMGDPLIRLPKFPFGNSEENINTLLEGEWRYSGHEYVFLFDRDGNYSFTSPEDTITGTYEFDGTVLILYADGEYIDMATLGDQGRLYFEGDSNGYYYKHE